MKLKGPYIYEITVKSNFDYSVMDSNGKTTFVSPVTGRGPKLYVFSNNGNLIYIGQTIQGMSARMRLGFNADGTRGYWGYQWRKELPKATLHIWCLEGAQEEEELKILECIESEVVFKYRSAYKKWPEFQTEIHFHKSTIEHIELASTIFQTFQASTNSD
jgi:hypothetical protein